MLGLRAAAGLKPRGKIRFQEPDPALADLKTRRAVAGSVQAVERAGINPDPRRAFLFGKYLYRQENLLTWRCKSGDTLNRISRLWNYFGFIVETIGLNWTQLDLITLRPLCGYNTTDRLSNARVLRGSAPAT